LTDGTPIKLSQLTGEIAATIASSFSNKFYWVIAEITSHKYQADKGYRYFTMVEKAETGNAVIANISGAAWASGNQAVLRFERSTGQKFTDNIQILAKVTVEYHPKHGLKLTLHDIDENFTIGALEAQRRATLERLLSECSEFIQRVGDRYITTNNKLPLPPVIQRIAVVTSSQSAGYQDFLHTIEGNQFGYKFSLDKYFTVVQGELNAELVYNKLLEVFNSGIKYDVVVIIRGGGQQTDFLIFNQFILGKIVAKFPYPIITGIGHQQNETIVDIMAHTATKTPTKVAEFIIAHNRAFEENILNFQKSVLIKTQQIFSIYNQRLSSITLAVSSKPKTIVANKLNDLQNLILNLNVFNKQYLKNQRGYLGHFHTFTSNMSPDNILKKGFAVLKVNGKIVSDPGKIAVGTTLTVLLSKIKIDSTVKSKTDYGGNIFDV
jgi:exodeoxyribonuclease VII large subunit